MGKLALIRLIIALVVFIAPLFAAAKEPFTVDPMIHNQGPTVYLATSDLPKAPLIYTTGDQIDWNKPGLRIEQLRLVADKLQIRFAYARLPWVRALKLTERGVADAVFVTGYTEERAEWGAYPVLSDGEVNFSQAISSVSYWLYSRQGSAVSWDGKKLVVNETTDAGKVSIGASFGDMQTEQLQQQGYSVFNSRNNEQLMKMVEGKRIDAAVCFRDLCDKIILANPESFAHVQKHPLPYRQSNGYLVFGKKYYADNQPQVDAIWEALQQLREDGSMESLYHKWGWR
ncbi:ABC transporter substrate-binding protein [Motiliproteus sp. MSK22-1]|uniref:substrate-binding periplasmic protein n=1 Tax=Motiliproteus sp. MSK22-1 TaxID=1897630 RepID=UPI0009785842|nr:transporter substrate-binding domain-containing protein [Motiliproteus sp. MSK22-1]OMH38008.1 hypothetical protein BGP75_06895 [Motiliproteus sp. MSK22-1]